MLGIWEWLETNNTPHWHHMTDHYVLHHNIFFLKIVTLHYIIPPHGDHKTMIWTVVPTALTFMLNCISVQVTPNQNWSLNFGRNYVNFNYSIQLHHSNLAYYFLSAWKLIHVTFTYGPCWCYYLPSFDIINRDAYNFFGLVLRGAPGDAAWNSFFTWRPFPTC